jgi:hypothetical protein
MKRIALAIVSAALLIGLLTPAPRAQVFGASGNPVWTGIISSQNPTGSSPILPLAGHATCSVVAQDTTAATVTVLGTAQVNPTIGSQWFPNPNFGTSGVISVTSSPATTTGNIANYPGGFYFTWTGNTGTLTAYAACSTAGTSAGGSGTSNVNIVGPLAASPAPSGVIADGYNAAGAASKIICMHQATVSVVSATATSTTFIPAVAGKAIYVCAYSLTQNGSGNGGIFYNATCTLPVTNVIAGSIGNSILSGGSGVGVVGFAPAGSPLCFAVNNNAPVQGQASVMYEQFLRALTAQEVEDRCTVPKRCVLYGLFKHLDRLLDRVSPP